MQPPLKLSFNCKLDEAVSLRGEVVKKSDFDIVVSEFERQSCNSINFQTNILGKVSVIYSYLPHSLLIVGIRWEGGRARAETCALLDYQRITKCNVNYIILC